MAGIETGRQAGSSHKDLGFMLRVVGRHCRVVSKEAIKRSGINFEINKTDLGAVASAEIKRRMWKLSLQSR